MTSPTVTTLPPRLRPVLDDRNPHTSNAPVMDIDMSSDTVVINRAPVPPGIRPSSTRKVQHLPGSSFPEKMEELRKCGWYWGPIEWNEAENLLTGKASGTFLLRDSMDDRYLFTLSFKTDYGIHHVRVNQHGGTFFFSTPGSWMASKTVVGLIEVAMQASRKRSKNIMLHPHADGIPVETIVLLHPCSRFSFVSTLKHATRFEILKHVRTRNQIDCLPLPTGLREYLKDPKYITELCL